MLTSPSHLVHPQLFVCAAAKTMWLSSGCACMCDCRQATEQSNRYVWDMQRVVTPVQHVCKSDAHEAVFAPDLREAIFAPDLREAVFAPDLYEGGEPNKDPSCRELLRTVHT